MANTAPAPSWLDNIGGFITSAGKLFIAGTEVYIGADQRVKAIEALNDDKTNVPAKTSPQVVSGQPGVYPSWVMPAVAVGLVIVGIFVARKMRS